MTVNFMLVTPTGKGEPGLYGYGVYSELVGKGSFMGVGVVQFTTAVGSPESVTVLTDDGQTTTGGVVSVVRVTLKVQLALFPEVSVPVAVTRNEPAL